VGEAAGFSIRAFLSGLDDGQKFMSIFCVVDERRASVSGDVGACNFLIFFA